MQLCRKDLLSFQSSASHWVAPTWLKRLQRTLVVNVKQLSLISVSATLIDIADVLRLHYKTCAHQIRICGDGTVLPGSLCCSGSRGVGHFSRLQGWHVIILTSLPIRASRTLRCGRNRHIIVASFKENAQEVAMWKLVLRVWKRPLP